MKHSMHYKHIAIRMLFVVLLFLVMAAPQLMSARPAGGFAEIRRLLENTPLATWIIIGAIALVALAAFSFIRYLRTPSTEIADALIAQRLAIQEAVLPQNKGNGLASDTFPLDLPWFGIAGWLHIEEGKECIVVDGHSIVRKTRLYFTPMRLFGKPIYARRVIINPATLTDVSVPTTTKDRFELTLVTSVSYSVTDPKYVAALQDPLTELTNRITGAIIEYIHSYTLEELFGDEGGLKQELKRMLEASPTIRGFYQIKDVLKALPSGDERIMELIRKIHEETSRRGLIEQQGANKLIIAEYELAIERQKAELQYEFEERHHELEKEMQQIKLQAQLLGEVMRMVAQIASSGVNPTGAIEEIRKLLQDPSSGIVREIPRPALTEENLLVIEQQMLERHKDALGITLIEIKPHPAKQTSPGQTQVAFPDFTLFIECSPEYPRDPPSAQIQIGDGDRLDITVPWQESSHLIEVAATAKMRAHAELENRIKVDGGE